MQYFETDLFFNEALPQEKNLGPSLPEFALTENLGIKVLIGNKPLVYNLNALSPKTKKSLKAATLDKNKDYFLVAHSIGALRLYGKAKIDELHYFAEAVNGNLQTIDLIPNTRFREKFAAGLTLEGSLSVTGEASPELPEELVDNLISQIISIGGNMQLQLSSHAHFAGKFSFRSQTPVVQSMGIGSSFGSWVLAPSEPGELLLGDHLLIQSIAVPKGTDSVVYKLSGVVKADKGIFWKQQQKETPEYIVEIKLN